MQKILLSLLLIPAALALNSRPVSAATDASSTTSKATQAIVELSVPFTSEIPNGAWVGPWKNACEEAAMTMVDQFYSGKNEMSKTMAIQLMTPLINVENKVLGYNANTDAEEIAKIMNNYTSAGAKVVDNPTLTQIKNELDNKRPVITLHYGFGLHNPVIPFLPSGSSYHTMVLIGYNDNTQEFIVNDPGNEKGGLDYHYKYDTILTTLHDFSHKTGKADGPARAIFTYQNTLAKVSNKPAIYWVENGVKHHIVNPTVFAKRGWKWSNVKTVDADWLDNIPSAEPVSQ